MPIAGRTAWTGAHAADGSRGRWQACSVDAVRGGWAKKPRPTAAQRQRASTRPVPTPAGCVRWEGRGGARTGSRGRLSPRGVVRALGRRVELTQHVGSAPASRHDRTTNQTSGRSAARPPSHENPSEQHLWQPIYPCPGAPRAATGEQSDQGDHRHPRSEHSGVAAGQGSPERSICGRLERNPTPERQKRAVSDGRRAFEAQSRARGRDEGVLTSRRAGTEAERSPTRKSAAERALLVQNCRARLRRPSRSVAVESAALNLHGVDRRRTWHSR